MYLEHENTENGNCNLFRFWDFIEGDKEIKSFFKKKLWHPYFFWNPICSRAGILKKNTFFLAYAEPTWKFIMSLFLLVFCSNLLLMKWAVSWFMHISVTLKMTFFCSFLTYLFPLILKLMVFNHANLHNTTIDEYNFFLWKPCDKEHNLFCSFLWKRYMNITVCSLRCNKFFVLYSQHLLTSELKENRFCVRNAFHFQKFSGTERFVNNIFNCLSVLRWRNHSI